MTSARNNFRTAAIAVFLLALSPQAQARTDNDVQVEPRDEVSPDSTISKDEWKLRIDQARDRAEQARRAWRLAPRGPRKADAPEKIATERVLADDTLQPGDIVATDRGLFLFRRVRRIDGEKREFIPLTPR